MCPQLILLLIFQIKLEPTVYRTLRPLQIKSSVYIFVLIHALITVIHVPNEMKFVINKLTNCVGNVKR